MSIAHFSPTSSNQPEPQQHSVVSDLGKHAVYDNRFTPSFSLEASLQGSPWEVENYFRQILGVADAPKELDINVEAAYQYYEDIERLELLVQSPLRSSTDSKTQITSTTGDAIIFSFLRPNVCDYFTAKSNIGRLGLFIIRSVERLTHEKESVHRVTYEMIEELTASSQKLLNLKKKTSVSKVFVKNRLIENLNPILLKETYEDTRRLGSDLRSMANDYWRSFYRKERGSLFMPGQPHYVYDPFVVDFFNKVVGSDLVTDKQNMIFLSENNDPLYSINNIWSLLQRRGLEDLPYCFVTMYMVPPSFFKNVTLARSAFFANTDFTVYPKSHDRSADIVRDHKSWSIVNDVGGFSGMTRTLIEPSIDFDPSPTTNGRGVRPDTGEFLEEVGGITFPLYNNVVGGENYIFQPEFFEGHPTSVLEILLLDYIGRKPLNLSLLIKLIKCYPKMPRVEQFYYGPMLMVMIREAIRGAYA